MKRARPMAKRVTCNGCSSMMAVDFSVARYPESTRVVCPWCDYAMQVTTDAHGEIRPLAWVEVAK